MAIQGRGGPARGAKPLAEILNDLFAARGLGRLQAKVDLDHAWSEAVGEPGCRHSRVEVLKNGILNVTVAHPTLLEELRSFQKASLLEALRRSLPETILHDIRFRVGPVSASPSLSTENLNPPTPPNPKANSARTIGIPAAKPKTEEGTGEAPAPRPTSSNTRPQARSRPSAGDAADGPKRRSGSGKAKGKGSGI